MGKRLPKVLMLGWEFPPIINGGLGIACHDLSSAMSEMADITMIVPKTSPDFKVKNLNLLGMNNIHPEMLKGYPSNYRKPLPFNFHYVPADLNPYYSEASSGEGHVETLSGLSIEKILQSFNIDNLYGKDVINKVIQFSELTAALASKMDFDVIHAHDWMTMIAGMRIKHESGKPLAVHIHSLEVDRSGPASKGFVYDLEKLGMEYADLLLPVSNFTAKNITKHYGINPSKISVVHNGSSFVDSYKSKRHFKEKTVLFVGRLTMQKGPERFVEIARKVLEKKQNVRFIMAGVGDYFRNLVEKSSYHQLGNRFHMTGFLNSEKLRYLLSITDVYCMPSVSEPFGLSAIEAAQFGIPCVISKQSGVAEVLNGSLKFDHWDVNRAADCILNLLNNKTLHQKVAEDASHNLKNVSWDISAGKVMQAYSKFKFI